MAWLESITPNYSAVSAWVRQRETKPLQGSPLKIAFLGNITLDFIATYFKYYSYKESFAPQVYLADYGTAAQEILSPHSGLKAFQPDIVVLAFFLEQLAPALTARFAALNQKQVEEEKAQVLDHIIGLLDNLIREHSASIFIHNFETPTWPALGILESQKRFGQAWAIQDLNEELRQKLSDRDGAFLINLDLLQGSIGRKRFIDRRNWHMARAPYSNEASRALAWEYMKYIRAIKGRQKKCLVLDCDGTLWGGIVGEDGLAGIQLGHSYPGSAFLDFQRALLELIPRGVLLAICSKNNHNDVIEVLKQHPDMLLRPHQFVAMRINWQDKAANLRSLSEELNIGLDSLVFIDDSEFEVGLVRELLPEVTAIHLPADPAEYANIIKSSGLFDSLSLTLEDGQRTEMYRAQVQRRQAETEFENSDVLEYIKNLNMKAKISFVDSFFVPRATQLTQRTNQFNLTTKRYTEDDIDAIGASKQADVILLQMEDKFGPLGVVGLAILRYENDVCLLDSFLMSCRVLGRGVEDVFLHECLVLGSSKGCNQVIGIFKPTAKNKQVAEFYPKHGFNKMDSVVLGPEPEDRYFRTLECELTPPDSWIEVEHLPLNKI